MSQHNIIGSEAFSGRRYILVREVRSSIGRRRRRRRNGMVMVVVAIAALLLGIGGALFALGPVLVQQSRPLPPAQPVQSAEDLAQMRMQPVQAATADEAAAPVADVMPAPAPAN